MVRISSAPACAGPGETGEDLADALAAGVDRHSRRVAGRAPTTRCAGGLRRHVGRVLLRAWLPVAAPGASLVMGGRPSPFTGAASAGSRMTAEQVKPARAQTDAGRGSDAGGGR